MRFLYIVVLQILNQMVDLMLRIVGHAPRDRYLHSTFWGQCNWCPPNANFLETCPPCPPRDLRPWFRDVGLCKDQASTPSWL